MRAQPPAPRLVLLAVGLLICSCATSSKRFSQVLENQGFSITVYEHDRVLSPTVTVTDRESTDRLIRWFQHRPAPAGTFGSTILAEFEQEAGPSLPFKCPEIRIETTGFRVKMRMFTVVLETQSSSGDEWTTVRWRTRDEDFELRDWLLSLIKADYRSIELDYLRILMERRSANDPNSNEQETGSHSDGIQDPAVE